MNCLQQSGTMQAIIEQKRWTIKALRKLLIFDIQRQKRNNCTEWKTIFFLNKAWNISCENSIETFATLVFRQHFVSIFHQTLRLCSPHTFSPPLEAGIVLARAKRIMKSNRRWLRHGMQIAKDLTAWFSEPEWDLETYLHCGTNLYWIWRNLQRCSSYIRIDEDHDIWCTCINTLDKSVSSRASLALQCRTMGLICQELWINILQI